MTAKPAYVFNWTFYIACNYRCEYCFFDGNWEALQKLNRVPDLEIITRSWEDVYNRYGQGLIQISGGEPTVYPRFGELMAELSRWHDWTFNTNLWWDAKRWENFSRRDVAARGIVQFSYHPTQEPDFEGFLEKAAFVNGLGFRKCYVCIVAYPPFIEKLPYYCERIREKGLDSRVQPLSGIFRGLSYPGGYSSEEKQSIRDLNQEGNSNLSSDLEYATAEKNPFGKPCRSGQYYCNIDQKGDITRCTQVNTEILGNLYEGFQLNQGPTPCPLTFCRCGESRWLVDNGPNS